MRTPFPVPPLTRRPDTDIVVPGSKSHTNRALVCAALAEGTSILPGALFAEDTLAMVGALRALGVGIETDHPNRSMTIEGCGGRFQPGPLTLDVAQSGTTSRFILAALTLADGPYLLDGDEQLRARPFGPLVESLVSLGASIDGDRLPVTVSGRLHTGTVALGGSVSSQFLSALLLAAPLAVRADGGEPTVTIELSDELVSKPYVELTMTTMAAFGVSVDGALDDGVDGRRFSVAPQAYRACELPIEPDASAASYFFAAAAITGGRVRVTGLGTDTIQGDLRFVDVLERMGATVRRGPDWTEVEGRRLRGVEVDMADISDTAQSLAVVATFATGPTKVTGIGFIRRKETDRLAAVVAELNRLGIRAEEDDDGFTIHPGSPQPGQVVTYDDHRMAMSFSLLGLVHPGITIDEPGCVAKTFPDFFDVLAELAR